MVQETDLGKIYISRVLYFSNISTDFRLFSLFSWGWGGLIWGAQTDYICSLHRVLQIHFSAKCFAHPGSGGALLLDYQQVRMDCINHFLSRDLSYGVFKKLRQS